MSYVFFMLYNIIIFSCHKPKTCFSFPTKSIPLTLFLSAETAKLTKAMIEENKKLNKPEDWVVVSYSSTDVMGDSRSLVATPLLAQLGFKAPSIHG